MSASVIVAAITHTWLLFDVYDGVCMNSVDPIDFVFKLEALVMPKRACWKGCHLT